ncbi:MAG: histidinol-phosphatase HisJ [bacterium]|nr:histidinol-phosphatase HisJ [bacterium]
MDSLTIDVKIMRDYHVHTYLCKHAYHEMEEYVEAALERGITEMCFTDHIPLPGGFDPGHRMEPDQIELYLELVETCRRKYKEISIFTGIEADYIDGSEEYLEGFFKKYSFDMVIMAIHFIKKWPPDQWVFKFDFPGKTIKECYSDYFEAMNRGISTGFFDVVGHLDLIKQPDYPILETNRDDIEMIFDNVLKQNMAIEINTSGFRRAVAEPYPSLDIIELAVARGIPISMGSDAHLPDHMGCRFKEVQKKIAAFKGLKMKMLTPKTL